MIVQDWLERWSDYTPDKIALKEYETGQVITYKELNLYAESLKRILVAQYELTKNDIVAILAENSIQYVALLGVTQKLGISLAPLNYRLTITEIDFLLETTLPKVLIYEEKFQDKINRDTADRLHIQLIEKSALSFEPTEISNGEENPSLIDRDIIEVNEDDAALIIFTSGTTGQPKGCIYTHKMMLWNSINTALRLDLTSKDRSINCAPPFHTGGWNVLMTPFLHHGAYTVLMRSFDPDNVLKCLEEESINVWWAVPTMLKIIYNSPHYDRTDLSKIRYFVVGGEAMPLELIKIWHEKGIPIRQGYGLTEVGPNITSLNEEDVIRKIGSIGKPNFYCRVKVIKENGEEAKINEPGELWISGPNVSPGYLNIKSNHDLIDGWFKTGDIVIRDQEGYFFVVDRLKHMYISGGENVYPSEIEKVIQLLPEVEEVAILGVPDDKWGEVGKAYIAIKKGLSIKQKDVIEHCLHHLAKYKVPKYIDFLQELPKNDSGKIDKKRLKKNLV